MRVHSLRALYPEPVQKFSMNLEKVVKLKGELP